MRRRRSSVLLQLVREVSHQRLRQWPTLHAEQRARLERLALTLLHPTTIIMRGTRPGPMPGVVTDTPFAALGHTTARGPVFIAWDAVEAELLGPQRTTNVILHEFAHKIDALDGSFDGTPRLDSREQRREWIEVGTAELAALRRGEAHGVLRAYAATNPSEFFAVATEAFFEQPVALRAQKPDLYRVLAQFYGQDTAGRETAPVLTTSIRDQGGP